MQLNKIHVEKLILPSSLHSQEIPEFYGTWKFISVHKTLQLGPILSQMIPVHTLPYCLRSVLVFRQYIDPPKWSFPLCFLTKTLLPFTNFMHILCVKVVSMWLMLIIPELFCTVIVYTSHILKGIKFLCWWITGKFNYKLDTFFIKLLAVMNNKSLSPCDRV
jgi:hypothetical protein